MPQEQREGSNAGEASSEQVDAASAALSLVPTAFLVIGTRGPQGAHYMVANWGTQASFDPWRYVIALKNEARTLRYAKEAGGFTVNFLDEAHKGVVKEVLKSKGWDGHAGKEGVTQAPRLPEAFAGFDCRLLDTIDVGGDHQLAIGEIVAGWKDEEAEPLTLADLKMSYSG
jgi:flavin reductase (DIM6/NTAB) family NADH-FMN oxidoreductase RutF